MLQTQNLMDDCVFSNASDIRTFVNFVMDLSEASDCVDVDVVHNFTNRNSLSISYCWYKEISQQQKCEDIMWGYSIDVYLDNIYHSFS